MNIVIKPPEATPPPAPRGKSRMHEITEGVIAAPPRILLYGPEGIGKSTFASGSPNAVFLGADGGTLKLNVKRFPQPRDFGDILDAIRFLLDEKHEHKTLVLDPLNWFEPLIVNEVLGTSGKTIEDWGGGYGRGYAAATEKWRQALALIERVWSERQMTIIFTAHSTVKLFNDPNGSGYDRFEVALNKGAAGLLKQWVDYVLFARHESFEKIDEKTKKVKGKSTGARLIMTQPTAAWDAKSRTDQNHVLPAELPLSWIAFHEAINAKDVGTASLLAEIDAGLKELADADVEATVRAYLVDAKGNPARIAEIAAAVANKITERTAQ